VRGTTPSPSRLETTRDRLVGAVRRLGLRLEDLVRRARFRRVTLRGRDGTVWVRLPLLLAALVVTIAAVWWLPLVVLAAIALFALGGQLTIDRLVTDDPQREA
jgi:hypothetical protein